MIQVTVALAMVAKILLDAILWLGGVFLGILLVLIVATIVLMKLVRRAQRRAEERRTHDR